MPPPTATKMSASTPRMEQSTNPHELSQQSNTVTSRSSRTPSISNMDSFKGRYQNDQNNLKVY
jgi:hypothetical protein